MNLILFAYENFTGQNRILKTAILPNMKDTTLVLMEDAVLLAVEKDLPQAESITYLCLQEDLKARGFAESSIPENIKIISYPDVIDLISQAERVISWL